MRADRAAEKAKQKPEMDKFEAKLRKAVDDAMNTKEEGLEERIKNHTMNYLRIDYDGYSKNKTVYLKHATAFKDAVVQ